MHRWFGILTIPPHTVITIRKTKDLTDTPHTQCDVDGGWPLEGDRHSKLTGCLIDWSFGCLID